MRRKKKERPNKMASLISSIIYRKDIYHPLPHLKLSRTFTTANKTVYYLSFKYISYIIYDHFFAKIQV